MGASDELHKLSEKAKEAEEKAAAARQQAKADLEKALQRSRESMQAHSAKLQEDAKSTNRKVSGWWDEQQMAWNASVARMHQNMDEHKVQHEAKVAEREADQAESDAYFAIDFAYGAIEAAEYTVLNAILARENADEAAATAGATKLGHDAGAAVSR